MNRREFMICAAGAAALGASAGEDGSAGAAEAEARKFCATVAPPGAGTIRRFTSRCSACGLCISSCPGKALRAAGLSSYGLAGMMMPRLDFANGFCSPDCHKCAEVCPAGAIEKASSPEARARICVGVAQWRHWECLTQKDSPCGLCAERCPNKAITMVKSEGDKFAHPVVDAKRCTGCGKCEYYCPAKPKAISVQGLAVQETALH